MIVRTTGDKPNVLLSADHGYAFIEVSAELFDKAHDALLMSLKLKEIGMGDLSAVEKLMLLWFADCGVFGPDITRKGK